MFKLVEKWQHGLVLVLSPFITFALSGLYSLPIMFVLELNGLDLERWGILIYSLSCLFVGPFLVMKYSAVTFKDKKHL